ncbi:MAG: DUF4442 domain-containing protein [Chitinophagales bacterium]|nr:DUF4442 domain-containing protein [Chitinophagales bacterium]
MNKRTFFENANSRFRMGLYMFLKLPAAWFMGLRVVQCNEEKCAVALPYRWRSQNPFRSTYFAAQCAAGEMSTGLLALACLQEQPPVSMLVTHIEADFFKKASETLTFTCEEGALIEATIQQVLSGEDAHTLLLHSKGRLPDGTIASEIRVQWSFKRKGSS